MEISYTRDLTVFALARLTESRDPETGEHLTRMRAYSQILAEQLQLTHSFGNVINASFLDNLYRASPLHDIGKISIPDRILLKPARLTKEEFEIMKTHTTVGAATLEDASRHSSVGGFLEMAIEVARSHHERFDGNGYPEGLAGDEIPLSARIVSVADVFDALTSKRVYKEAIDTEIAKQMIIDESGSQFDPKIVRAFEQSFGRLLTVSMKYSDYGCVPLSAISCAV